MRRQRAVVGQRDRRDKNGENRTGSRGESATGIRPARQKTPRGAVHARAETLTRRRRIGWCESRVKAEPATSYLGFYTAEKSGIHTMTSLKKNYTVRHVHCHCI